VKYQREMKDVSLQTSEVLPNKIKFAVNVDIGSWNELLNDIKKNLDPRLVFHSEEDSLKVIR
jgi:hypothetical protein